MRPLMAWSAATTEGEKGRKRGTQDNSGAPVTSSPQNGRGVGAEVVIVREHAPLVPLLPGDRGD
jgi:hypothetical protein